jgi:hypothetical protein
MESQNSIEKHLVGVKWLICVIYNIININIININIININ